MTRPLRAALAACGGISALALDAAGRDYAIAAIQDPDAAARARVGDARGIARRHARFEELLTPDIDFVIVNSPNHLHAEQVQAAAAAGIPCLVQKPMARTAAEAEEMIAAAGGVKLGVVMFELGKPLHHQLRAMVRGGWLGEPVLVDSVSAHDIYLRDPPAEGDWRRDPAKVGGGAFIQLGIHHVNLATWLLADEPVAVSATGTRGHTVFADETTCAVIRFASGTIGRFAASYAADLYGFSVIGTRGRVHLSAEHVMVKGAEAFAGDVFHYDRPGHEAVIPLADLTERIAALAPDHEIHNRFARWIAQGEPFPCPAEHALRDLGVLDAVHAARRSGATIRLANADSG